MMGCNQVIRIILFSLLGKTVADPDVILNSPQLGGNLLTSSDDITRLLLRNRGLASTASIGDMSSITNGISIDDLDVVGGAGLVGAGAALGAVGGVDSIGLAGGIRSIGGGLGGGAVSIGAGSTTIIGRGGTGNFGSVGTPYRVVSDVVARPYLKSVLTPFIPTRSRILSPRIARVSLRKHRGKRIEFFDPYGPKIRYLG